MSERSPTENSTCRNSPSDQRVVYVLAEDAMAPSSKGLDILELCGVIWKGRWILITITAVFVAAATVYAITATEWYEAELEMAPADESSAPQLSGALGGLATLAGVNLDGSSVGETLAVLTSRDFTREFIHDENLIPLLSEQISGDAPAESLDIRDAVEFFDKSIRTVSEDSATGLVIVRIRWTDPSLAAEWANQLVSNLNDRMRHRALSEAEKNVAYLQAELQKTTVLTLQQSIGSLLERELQKVMLARGKEEFAFRVIDRAEAPKRRTTPKRTLIVTFATAAGAVVSLLVILIVNAFGRLEAKND